jgi:hypothetical protein
MDRAGIRNSITQSSQIFDDLARQVGRQETRSTVIRAGREISEGSRSGAAGCSVGADIE